MWLWACFNIFVTGFNFYCLLYVLTGWNFIKRCLSWKAVSCTLTQGSYWPVKWGSVALLSQLKITSQNQIGQWKSMSEVSYSDAGLKVEKSGDVGEGKWRCCSGKSSQGDRSLDIVGYSEIKWGICQFFILPFNWHHHQEPIQISKILTQTAISLSNWMVHLFA